MTFTMHKMLIGGAFVDASDHAVIEVTDPATGIVVGTTPRATSDDLDAALTAAVSGWNEWRRMTGWDRSAILRKAAEILETRSSELSSLLTLEQGKPIAEARAELASTVEQLDWYADEARRVYGRIVGSRSTAVRMQVLREPIGPVAAFTPWNFPILLASRKVAPALAAGCSMVLKPAEEAPGAAIGLASALVDAGLPAGVLNVVTGRPDQVSEHLLKSGTIRKVSLTGSTAVGRQLLRQSATEILDVSMELGGHAPVVVFDDVDAARIGALCARAKFRNAGQVCISATRFLVQREIAEAFTDAFVATTRALRLGSGLDPDTDVGPMAHHRGMLRAQELVDDAVAQGAELRLGGKSVPGAGFFFEPTVLTNVPSTARIAIEEPFAPVAPISTFETYEEALTQANASEFGLAGYIFTGRIDTATRAAEDLEVGIVGINTGVISGAQIPFGGVKHSGIGSENGVEGIDAYLHSKSVSIGLHL
jgi:succinate-semialdehyde dehydrogenase/glutarate-semialdehyde dehydrogenase